jgi:hypothetical protein
MFATDLGSDDPGVVAKSIRVLNGRDEGQLFNTTTSWTAAAIAVVRIQHSSATRPFTNGAIVADHVQLIADSVRVSLQLLGGETLHIDHKGFDTRAQRDQRSMAITIRER